MLQLTSVLGTVNQIFLDAVLVAAVIPIADGGLSVDCGNHINPFIEKTSRHVVYRMRCGPVPILPCIVFYFIAINDVKYILLLIKNHQCSVNHYQIINIPQTLDIIMNNILIVKEIG